MVALAVAVASGGLHAQAHDVPARPSVTVAQMQEDLERFRTEFLGVDVSYSPEARSRAEARLRALEARLADVSAAEFELTLAQIVGLADNGHTIAFAGPRSRRFNRVPIRVTPFGEDFHVLRATAAHADLLGARVVAVGGTPIAQILDSARTLAGGTPGRRDRDANYVIESPEQMHALGLIAGTDTVRYEFETAGGDRVARRLQADPANDDRVRADASRWLSPELVPAEQGTWQALLGTDKVPWALQDIDEPFRSRDAPDLDATVVQLRRNHDAPGRPIAAALQELTAAIEAGGRTHLVLDMRFNGGGDLNTTRSFMQSLPDLVPGRILVLMSPWTFSAAISSIGYLEQTAPERVTLVGEGPGDRLEFFAEGGVVALPHSGAMLLTATERHDYRTGCEGKVDCHRPVVRHPIAVPSLAPDIPAPWTFAAYAAGRDPGMEAVARALGGR
jgi:hypothetical protein